MGKIISFTNQKGGVGKTTTCVNVASYVASFGKRVLIVDIDPQGNATSGLGINKSRDMYTLYDAIDSAKEITEVIRKTDIKNLDIIPSTIDLAGAEIEIIDSPHRESIVKHLLTQLVPDYDYIFIDCPPSLGLLTINALTASGTVIIPIQCEFFALEGLTQLMNTIKLVKEHLNPTLDVEGVVLTMKDKRSNLIKQVAAEIKKFFGPRVYNTYIPRTIRLAEAPSHGKPIMLYDPKGHGGVAYYELAKEFLERNESRS